MANLLRNASILYDLMILRKCGLSNKHAIGDLASPEGLSESREREEQGCKRSCVS